MIVYAQKLLLFTNGIMCIAFITKSNSFEHKNNNELILFSLFPIFGPFNLFNLHPTRKSGHFFFLVLFSSLPFVHFDFMAYVHLCCYSNINFSIETTEFGLSFTFRIFTLIIIFINSIESIVRLCQQQHVELFRNMIKH